MAIRDTLGENEFINRFMQIRPDNFSVEGLRQLYYYYVDLSDGIGEDIEFDPISICCEWIEYDSVKEAIEQYNNIDINSIEDLQNNTVVIPCGEGVLVQEF